MSNHSSDQPSVDTMNVATLCFQYCSEGKYQHALGEASQAIENDPTNVHAHIAMSESLLHLRAFEDAVLALQDWDHDPAAQPLLQRAQRCYQEHLTGNFNVADMIVEAITTQRVKHGDYVSPNVGLDRRAAVRGLFARNDMKRGTLVIAEKAVFSVFPEDPATEASTLEFEYEPASAAETDPINIRLVFKAIKTIIQYKCGGHIFNLHDVTRVRDSDTGQAI